MRAKTRTDRPGKKKPTRLQGNKRGGSFLPVKTTSMERERRLREQEGQRKLGKVNVTEHDEEQKSNRQGNERSHRKGKVHRRLAELQRFDGTYGKNMSQNPENDPEALMKIDNKRREQDKEHQLKLNPELAAKLGKSNTPTLRKPGVG